MYWGKVLMLWVLSPVFIVLVFLGLGSPQAGMALQEGSGDCYLFLMVEGNLLSLEECRAQAEAGDVSAQTNLGVMYANGEGVVQDDARAYLWFNLAVAASQGDARARRVESRDSAAARLSPTDRAAAQRLATQCQASGFKDCGEPQ